MTRKQQFVTWSLTWANCGSWVPNLNQWSVIMLVRTELWEVALPLAWSAAFKLGFSPFAWLGYNLEYLGLQTESNLGFLFFEIRRTWPVIPVASSLNVKQQLHCRVLERHEKMVWVFLLCSVTGHSLYNPLNVLQISVSSGKGTW